MDQDLDEEKKDPVDPVASLFLSKECCFNIRGDLSNHRSWNLKPINGQWPKDIPFKESKRDGAQSQTQ